MVASLFFIAKNPNDKWLEDWLLEIIFNFFCGVF